LKAPIYVLALVSVVGLSSCLFQLKYTVGGTVTGLRGTGLVIEDNSGNALSVIANSVPASIAFTFTKGIAKGQAYAVTVTTQPSNPAQTCTVHNGSGTMDKTNVTNVIVNCTQAGRYAYVADQNANVISAFLIDAAASGNLTAMSGSPYPLAGTVPVALAIDPNGQFLYVVYNGSGEVTAFAIDDATGLLTPAGVATATGGGPVALTIDPTGRFLYVANSNDNTVSAFQISSGGFLTLITGSPFTVGRQPSALQTDPVGSFLYVTNLADNNVTVLAIDSVTGALSNVSGSPFGAGTGPVWIAVDPLGTFAFVANATAASISSYSINSSTGALTAIGSALSTGSAPQSLALDPAGKFLYAANVTSNDEITPYTIGSGALTPGAPAAAGNRPFSIVVDPMGQFVYTANFNSGNVTVFSADANTGALTAVGTFAAGAGARSIVVD
jgi:6-phosphogluconolactonase